MQFRSLNPVIADAGAKYRDNLYYAFMTWQRALRDKQYKLIEYCVNGVRHTQLFDLVADPHETKNLAGEPDQADRLRAMRALLEKRAVELNDGNTPFEFTDKMGKTFWATYKAVKSNY